MLCWKYFTRAMCTYQEPTLCRCTTCCASITHLPVACCCLQEGITESFKPKYRLRSIGLCVPWWDSEMTAAAARNAARPLALQGSGAKAKLKQAAQQLAAAAVSAANAAAAVPAARPNDAQGVRRPQRPSCGCRCTHHCKLR
jgi:hypothetical protein